MNIATLQATLAKLGFNPGPIDGDLGGKTWTAIDAFLTKWESWLKKGTKPWNQERKLVAAQQLIFKLAGADPGDIDGYAGELTRNAEVNWVSIINTGKPQTWRDEVMQPSDKDPVIKNVWPRQSEMAKVYGAPGTNHTRLALPYAMRLAWDTSTRVTSITIHEKVAASAGRVLQRALDAYGLTRIQQLRLDLFGGCYNNRTMRGGSALSTHAYAVALDFDPERNQLKWGRDRASLAGKDYETWWRLWEEEGWLSLGRAKNFDWMHVQAARL